jgi:hypothetical protein
MEDSQMKNVKSNILIDLHKTVPADKQDLLIDAIRQETGVGQVTVSSRTSRLMFVDYDKSEITPQVIRNFLMGCGYNASLIGM